MLPLHNCGSTTSHTSDFTSSKNSWPYWKCFRVVKNSLKELNLKFPQLLLIHHRKGNWE